jgi:hypothetical protein
MTNLGKRALKKAEKKKKRLKRRKKAQNKKEKIARNLQISEDSLSFVFNPHIENSASEDFVRDATKILKGLRLSDRSVFTEPQARFFLSMKKSGFDFAINNAVLADHKYLSSQFFGNFDYEFGNRIKVKDIAIEKKEAITTVFYFLIGDILFQELNKRDLLDKYIPYNTLIIVPKTKRYSVTFKGMLVKHFPKYGTIYYPKHKPKLKIDGNELTIGLTTHAIHRISERCVKNWRTYGGASDVFTFFNNCNNFEIFKDDRRNRDQHYFTMYERCGEGFFSGMYPENILDKMDYTKIYHYRIGYCPIAVNGNFACGKTMLPPGMRGTPEDRLLRESTLSREEKSRIYRSAKNSFLFSNLIKSEDFTGLKWFHDNGVPQIVELPENSYIEPI